MEMTSAKLREKYKGRVNFLFQTIWITCTLAGILLALWHLPLGLSIPVGIFAIIIALQIWGQWDKPGSEG